MGQWLTSPVADSHRCFLPSTFVLNNGYHYEPGSIWQCQCGEKWRYEGEDWNGYSYDSIWINLKDEEESRKAKEALEARKRLAPWWQRPFMR